MSLSKPTLGVNTDYAARIGALFDKWNDGNYEFPATQVPSADPNTLDDYEEGTWTPAFTFVTPGNLSIAYSTQVADYTKIGRDVRAALNITTSTFTHTTASGLATITGLPFTIGGSANPAGSLFWGGITKASYTDFMLSAPVTTATLLLGASGSGQARSNVAAADTPTGGTVMLNGAVHYRV